MGAHPRVRAEPARPPRSMLGAGAGSNAPVCAGSPGKPALMLSLAEIEEVFGERHSGYGKALCVLRARHVSACLHGACCCCCGARARARVLCARSLVVEQGTSRVVSARQLCAAQVCACSHGASSCQQCTFWAHGQLSSMSRP